MSSKLCPFCMRMTNSAICPHCGKNIDYAGSPLHLPAGYVVRGKHPYVIGAALGQGGFGITYIALDMVTNMRVAIKEYFPTFCAARTGGTVSAYPNQEEIFRKGMERFLDEARVIKSLSDLKCIVDVLEFFEFNNSAYLVMEFLDGSSLKDYAARNGKFPAQKFLSQIHPLMDDIHRMHERGVVHRDIAPDNIILLPDGQMKLIDFGAARSFVGDRSMTVVVKKGFAPLEQYLTKGTTASTDVYALAATIYYCITGTVPMDSAERQYDDIPLQSPSSLGADITPLQEKALGKALEIQQKDRAQSVQEFADLLFAKEPVTRKSGTPDKTGNSAKKKSFSGKILAALAAVAAVLAVVLMGFFAPGGTGFPNEHSRETNILRSDIVTLTAYNDGTYATRRAFGSNILRNQIESITFLSTTASAPDDAWDVSQAQDQSVLAWVDHNGGLYDLYIAGDGGVTAPKDCDTLFALYSRVKYIDFNNSFSTAGVTNMHDMFLQCQSLETLDLSGFDTSATTSMRAMFHFCTKLKELDLSSFATSNVTDMAWMFTDCISLTSIDLSGFDTANVTDMSYMFNWCNSLLSPDLDNWDISRVKNYEFFMSDNQKINGRPWREFFEK